jgi:lysophospholipase L1-like esterase
MNGKMADLPSLRASAARPVKTEARTVACLGSSSTAGKGQAFDWIAELSRRPGNECLRFRNLGVGGDLAYNALRRLPDVVACHPDCVVVWIGANDVLALVSVNAGRFFRFSKRMPYQPSPQQFSDCLREIAQRLKAETSAAIGLCSLPPIGEDPASADAFQRDVNSRTKEYSAIIRRVAQEEHIGYIPLHEAMLSRIEAAPGRALTSLRLLPFYRDAFRALVLRRTPDEIAQMNGWRFHTDGVHLNGQGGMIVASLVQEFINR